MTQLPQNSGPGGFEDGIQYSAAPRSSGMAIAAMVLGILAMPMACILIGLPMGLVAVVLGSIALTKINAEPLRYSGKGMAITGIVTGGLGGVFVVPVMIAVLMPSLGKSRELANRAVCAANVRGIAQSMHVYGADNDDIYPTVATPAWTASMQYKLAAHAQAPGGASEAATYQSIYATNPTTNAGSPMACLWILCVRGDVAPKQFLCRSDPAGMTAGAPLTSAAGVYYTNFTEPATVANSDLRYSYSIAYPWSPDRTKAGPGGWWKAMSDASVPLLADMAPLHGTGRSTPGMAFSTMTKMANSNNHQRDGENIAYGDAHAEFQRTPFVGQDGDDIYSVGASGPAMPASTSMPVTTSEVIPGGWMGGVPGTYDTIMVPAANVETNARF